MLGLKLNHVSKKGPWCLISALASGGMSGYWSENKHSDGIRLPPPVYSSLDWLPVLDKAGKYENMLSVVEQKKERHAG